MLNQGYQVFPQGMTGGLNTTVLSGIVSGCKLAVTGTGIITVGGKATPQVSVSAGSLRFDGKMYTISSTITATLPAPVGLNLNVDFYSMDVYLLPTRKTKVVTTLPGSAVAGDVVFLCDLKEYVTGKYYLCNSIQKYTTAWYPIDPYKDIQPNEKSQNATPFSHILPTINSANVSVDNEIPVFLNTNRPPHIVSPPNALIRQSAGILLGTVEYDDGQGTVIAGTPDHQLLHI
jgi:hypothetical protein